MIIKPARLRSVVTTLLLLSGLFSHAADLTLGSRIQVPTNNANFDLSVFPGQAAYNDRGIGGSGPGNPSFRNPLGDGTVLDYNFIGNAGTGSPLTTYASGGAGRIPTPVAPSANMHGNGEDWANVWTTNDPGDGIVFSGRKNHNPTGVAGAANTFARCAELDGTIDISGLASGVVYIPHGSFVNDWTLTLTMTGAGQPDLVASETQGGNGPSTNFGISADGEYLALVRPAGTIASEFGPGGSPFPNQSDDVSYGLDPGGLNLPFLEQTQPTGWGGLSSGDFNMDPRVTRDTAPAEGHPGSIAGGFCSLRDWIEKAPVPCKRPGEVGNRCGKRIAKRQSAGKLADVNVRFSRDWFRHCRAFFRSQGRRARQRHGHLQREPPGIEYRVGPGRDLGGAPPGTS